MNSSRALHYHELTDRLREVACRVLPADATVAVVSKGDAELLKFEGRRAWHFPQRDDGVYAGYYPADSSAAIAHLESLRARGAEFLLFPHHSFWWLEHYTDFRHHLERHYREFVRDPQTCIIYALAEGALQSVNDAECDTRAALADLVPEERTADLNAVFDLEHYAQQAGCDFASPDAAILHYVQKGAAAGHNPHPLFDTKYYLSRYPHVRASGANPLLHFLAQGAARGNDPHPWFDTDYYYSQVPGLRVHKVNALVHYLANASENKACRPNPLFADAFYLDTYPSVRSAGCNPLVDYVGTGAAEGRFVSFVHRSMVETLLRSSKTSLLRGQWKNGTVLFVSRADSPAAMPVALRMVRRLAEDRHLGCLAILFRRQEWVRELEGSARTLVLEDFRLACDVLRPSALRMLAASLCGFSPLCAFVDSPEVLATLRSEKVPAYFFFDEENAPSNGMLGEAFEHARRVIFNSSEGFHSAAEALGHFPLNVALRPLGPAASPQPPARTVQSAAAAVHDAASEAEVASVMALARRDFGLPEMPCNPALRPGAATTRSIIIPCCDWSLSGVNSSLEALGKELIALGWDVRIVFTRSEKEIRQTVGADEHLPKLPCRYLDPRNPGLEGMWEALISEVENSAPCIMFMGYDFAGNGIAPALTDKVGVVGWVQSDDGDYYEQAYRLGRYCNAVVCVSERIRQGVAALNPLIGERATVIYNSSIWQSEIVAKRPPRAKKLRLIYTGRLVEYQKRILDFIDLARSLDRLGVPYQLTLIGEFSGRENAREIFEARAKAHLADGRIRLPGRMTRGAVMEHLTRHDVFLLLSDFEGLPLSLVEAMAAGCVPVVSEMESGIPEVISSGSNGFVVSGRDYKKWAALLAGLWKDRKRLSACSQQARQTVRERLTVEHVGGQFDRLFKSIAAEICSDGYTRPPSLHWGRNRSHTGDVLPPQSIYTPPMLWQTFGSRRQARALPK